MEMEFVGAAHLIGPVAYVIGAHTLGELAKFLNLTRFLLTTTTPTTIHLYEPSTVAHHV